MNILIIDLSSILYRIWHVSGDERNPNRVSDATVQACRQYAGEQPGAKVAICCDSRSSKRKEACQSYKANREAKPEALYYQLDRAKRLLANDGYAIFESDGYEADDCIGTIVEWSKDKGESEHCTVRIVTSDKDLIQLVDERVTIFAPHSQKVWTVHEVMEQFGVVPWAVRDWLSLVGDSADNIKGCPGCGHKNATEILRGFGSLATVYDALEKNDQESDIESIKPSIRKALREHKDDVMQAYKLIGLMPAPIDCARLLAPQEPKPTYEEAEVHPEEPEPEEIHPSEVKLAQLVEERSQPEQPKHVAMVRAPQDDGWAMALEPRNFEQAIVAAKRMFSSRLFGDVGTEDGALAKIMAGRALGLDVMSSLRGINVIKGKISVGAATIKGLCQSKRNICEYFRHIESNDRFAIYETKRVGDPPQRWKYTIEQAKRAGLAGQDNWQKRPDTMLRWRCIAELARDQYPDIVNNCYTPDEMAEIGE